MSQPLDKRENEQMASVRVKGRPPGKKSYGNPLKENDQLLKFLSSANRTTRALFSIN